MRSLSLVLFIGGFAFAAVLHLGAGTAVSRPQYAKELGHIISSPTALTRPRSRWPMQ